MFEIVHLIYMYEKVLALNNVQRITLISNKIKPNHLFTPRVVFWPSTRPKMPFKVMHRKEETHSNGSYERKSRRWARLIIWDKVKVPLQSDAPEESDLWTAWQLFPLDDDQTCPSKDWVGNWVDVELLYNSVQTEVRQLVLELEKKCGRESHTRPKGLSGPLMELGSREVADKMW